MRNKGVGIPIKADVADLCGGNQRKHSFHHAKTCPQNGHEGQLAAADDFGFGDGHGSLNLHLFQGQVTGGFVAHQGRNFGDQLPKVLAAGVLVPQKGDFVLDQRMVQNNRFHRFVLLISFLSIFIFLRP